MDKWQSKGLHQHPDKHRKRTYGQVCLSDVGFYYLRKGSSMISCPQSWAARIHQAENIDILREVCEAGGMPFEVVKMETGEKPVEKPSWWPECPYPEDVFPMKRERYPEIVSDPHVRTALSGCLGREFWNIASETIWDRFQEAMEETRDSLQDALKSIADMKVDKDTDHKQLSALCIGIAISALEDRP